MSTHTTEHARKLIESLGGPTELAKLLGYDIRKGGAQRVANWQRRGIPAEVRLERPDIFASIGQESKQAVHNEVAASVTNDGS